MPKLTQNPLQYLVTTRLTMNSCESFEDIARQQNTTVAALIRQVLMEWIDGIRKINISN
ncbi:MAG: hypothetical protein HEP80_20245 [Dolichospermum sp. UKL201]|jgi:hypothetical protein|nr:MAG: hypothetical protein HEP80_20245 [Dolichospermum sp. UKL201]